MKTILLRGVKLSGGKTNKLIGEERGKKGKMYLPEGNTKDFMGKKKAKE